MDYKVKRIKRKIGINDYEIIERKQDIKKGDIIQVKDFIGVVDNTAMCMDATLLVFVKELDENGLKSDKIHKFDSMQVVFVSRPVKS